MEDESIFKFSPQDLEKRLADGRASVVEQEGQLVLAVKTYNSETGARSDDRLYAVNLEEINKEISLLQSKIVGLQAVVDAIQAR